MGCEILECHDLLLLCEIQLPEVDLTQIPVDHEILFIASHVGVHICLSIHSKCLVSEALKLYNKLKWAGLGLFHQ